VQAQPGAVAARSRRWFVALSLACAVAGCPWVEIPLAPLIVLDVAAVAALALAALDLWRDR
jgi:hypothetical protein